MLQDNMIGTAFCYTLISGSTASKQYVQLQSVATTFALSINCVLVLVTFVGGAHLSFCLVLHLSWLQEAVWIQERTELVSSWVQEV